MHLPTELLHTKGLDAVVYILEGMALGSHVLSNILANRLQASTEES